MTTTKKPHEMTIPEIDESAPLALFNGDKLKLIIDQVEQEISLLVLDPTVASDHEQYGSIGRKIGSFFAAIDRAGKSLVDPLKKEAKKVDGQRKIAKDRGAELKANFMLPRTEYDAEVAAHVKAVAESFEMMQGGHHRIGEFRAATLAEWDAHIEAVKAVDLSESFFCERLAEAREVQGESLEMNTARRAKFIEDEAAIEAGRVALKVQQDAEAAKRHAERIEAAELRTAKHTTAASHSATPPAAEKPMSKCSQGPKSNAKNSVYGALCNYGMPKEQAVKFINSVETGQIKHLQIVV